MTTPSKPSKPGLRLRIAPPAETAVRAGHPWVFSESVRDTNRAGALGELAAIYDRKNKFLAIGLFDPDSPLRVRVLHAGKPLAIDTAWWRARLDQALERRRALFDARTTGYRWIHGENDGWPGLVLDRYGATLVLKLYTAAWFPRLAEVGSWISDRLKPTHLVLRLSRNIQRLAKAEFGLADGDSIVGGPWSAAAIFLETGLRFQADARRGQKTGFFLDQRENRRHVEALALGRRVLNAFSFSGGFSLYAARGGAQSVTDLDISAHALESSRRNFALNAENPKVAGCPHVLVQADAFDWLAANRRPEFDLVILDPPSLAKREGERHRALGAYRRLAASALPRLAPGGMLVASSCSAHVTETEFFEAIRSAVGSSGRKALERATTGHPPDHPATFDEARYLKCIYLELGK
jgi:23S rRNA (cytosine1962-C5)-methyltransferase